MDKSTVKDGKTGGRAVKNRYNREKIILVFAIALLLFVAASGLFLIYQSGRFSKAPEVEIKAENRYEETLRVVMGEYYPPFSFKRDGEYTGHDVELANEIANRLGMNVEIRYLTWTECLDEVQYGRADMVMSVDYEYPEEGIQYTIPVADNPWMAFSKGDVNSYAGLYGKRIGIGADTDALGDSAFRENYVVFDSYEPAFDALEKGEIDVVITKYPVGTYIADKKGYRDISATCELSGGHFAVGIREDRRELLERLNEIILAMSNDGTLSKLSGKWFGTFVKTYSLGDILGMHPEYFLVSAAVVLLLLAMIALLSIRENASRKAMARREAEESRRLIESIIGAYNIAYQVNMEDDTFRLLRMESALIDESQIAGFNTFTDVIEGLNSIIHPAGRDSALKALSYDSIRRNLKDKRSYRVEFRVLIDGVTSFHVANITRIDEDNFAIGFAERDLEITKRRLEEKKYEECFALLAADIDTGMIKVIKNEREYQACAIGKSAPYTPYLQGIAQTLDEEPKEFFLRLADIEYAKKEFATDDKRTYAYKSLHFAGDTWIDVTFYCILRHEDGTPAMFTIGFSFVDALGTARQELQDRIAAQSRELESALVMAQAANKAKTEFLFNMSHDIRTPMNAILGFTNMAKKHLDDREKVEDCLTKTQQSGNLLLTLINSILDVSRIESGSAEIHEDLGDVYYSFVNIESAMQEVARTKDIRLTFAFGEITDRYVYADFSRCMRVFTNLISNAIKYNNEGGYVKVFCEQISPAQNGVASYRYTVEDNGIGMSEEFQQRMYEAFTREKDSTHSGIQGTGLGLSVCKAFVEYLGGTIECTSRQGQGTRFTVIFPFRIQEGQQYTDPVSGEVVTGKPVADALRQADFSGRRVLLVEDNELNREIAAEILEEAGMTVEEAEDGTVAVDKMKERGPEYYDFILMDIQMPVMNGYEATKAIRALYPDKHIPIIALSANAFAEDKVRSREAGMDDHVAKPINLKELFAALAAHLRSEG